MQTFSTVFPMVFATGYPHCEAHANETLLNSTTEILSIARDLGEKRTREELIPHLT